MNSFSRSIAFVVAPFLAVNAASAGVFDTASISGGVEVHASLLAGTKLLVESDIIPITDGFQGISISSGAGVRLGDGSVANSGGSCDATFTLTTVSASGLSSSDVDNAGGADAGMAAASSTLLIVFSIADGESFAWTFTDGFAGGTHADAFVALKAGATLLFDSAAAATDLNDGFGGLFADSSFNFTLVLTRKGSTPCPADLNGDGAVDGADLGALLGAWGACPE